MGCELVNLRKKEKYLIQYLVKMYMLFVVGQSFFDQEHKCPQCIQVGSGTLNPH